MSWTVTLTDENHIEIESLKEEFVSKILSDSSTHKVFYLIKYLDPYGDTVFNHLQIDDLIIDLKKLREISVNKAIDEIINLALKCKSTQHSYLIFYGN